MKEKSKKFVDFCLQVFDFFFFKDSFDDNSLLSSNLSVPRSDKMKSSGGSPTSFAELTAPRPPKRSMNIKEWTDAICAIVGTRKARSDAAAMFK